MLDSDFNGKLLPVQAELATLEHIELAHTPRYVKQIISSAGREFTMLAPDTPVSAHSYLAAWLAVGGCVEALRALINQQCRVAFAMIRPPGHHALSDRAGGFCIFNNLGIAAKVALEYYGYKRILIIDWDIHHGNAIQDLFYKDKRVLYLSSHYMGWFPHTGDWGETGEDEGLGYNVNIPVFKEMGDQDIIHIYRDTLTPVVRRFRPQLIFVAAGFDAHQKDPLGRTRLTESSYFWLTQLVLQLSESVRSAPILFALEGGYDLWALVNSVRQVLGALTFEGRRERIPATKSQKAAEIVEKLKTIHKPYNVWSA